MLCEMVFRRWIEDDLVLDERIYPANARMPAHTDGIARVSIVLDGHVEESYESGVALSTPFRMFIKPLDSLHANTFGPCGARIFSVVSPRSTAFSKLPYGQTESPAALRALLAFRLLALRSARPSGDEITALLQQLCAITLPAPPAITLPSWWNDAEPLLSDAAVNRKSIAMLAGEIGVHTVHLNRLCHRAYGRPTRLHLRYLRAQRAASLLAQSRPIALAASEAGFTDQAHLTRVFRADLGITPAAYRRAVSLN